jgi:glycerol-3-phosphate cytidylyltransferase|tara:strand:- start:93 stop:509 length:417 start_codon:yes stop_codon:yes gene_type:complete
MNQEDKITGFVAGAFDVIHPGYISLFNDAREHCNYLVVGLHEDPSFEKSETKLKPILTTEERKEILLSLRQVNAVIVYKTEKDLYNILKHIEIDVRFLGSDYEDRPITGKELDIPIHFINREHAWSTTKFKKLISESI